MIRTERRGRYCFVIYINATLSFFKGFDGNYGPQPKDGKGNIFSLFTPGGTPAMSRWGYPSQVGMGVPLSRDGVLHQLGQDRGGTPSRDLVPPPGIGQQMEYLICGGQYVSCGRAGELSCVYHHTEKVGKKQKECWCWNKLFDLLSELPQVASSADCRKQSSFSQLIKSWQCCQHRHQNKQKIRKSLAWPQEAYSPLRSKCSICCTLGGGVTPVPARYPHPDLARGDTPVQSWLGGTPVLEYFPTQDWVIPWLGLGFPPALGPGYPKERTWDQRPGKEPGNEVTLGKNMGPDTWERTWDWGIPCEWTHSCENIPSPSFGCGR